MTSDIKHQLLAALSEVSTTGFAIGVGFDGFQPTFAHSAYPRDWQEYYLSHDLLLEDPTVIHGLCNRGHFTWEMLKAEYPKYEIFSIAERFGITEGNTFSYRIDGIVTIASVSGPKLEGGDLAQAQAAILGLHGLFAPVVKQPEFSPNEVAVLRLLAQGKRDGEIAEQLGCKIETIRARRNRMSAVTGSKTVAQLLSEVTKIGVV